MSRAYTLDFTGEWDLHLHLIEFTYSNNHHAKIGMAPFEEPYMERNADPTYTRTK